MFVIGFTISSYSEEESKVRHYHVIGGAFNWYVSKGDSIYDGRQYYDENKSPYNSYDKFTNFAPISTNTNRIFYSYLYLSESLMGFELTAATLPVVGDQRERCGNCRYIESDIKEFIPKTSKSSGLFGNIKSFSILFGVSQNNYLSIDLDYARDNILYKIKNAKKYTTSRKLTNSPSICKDSCFYLLPIAPTLDLTYNYLYTTNAWDSGTAKYQGEELDPKFNGIFSPDGIGIGMRHLFPDDSLYVGWSVLSYKTSYVTDADVSERSYLKFKYIYGYNIKIGWIIE
ncbi:MAG: hypothetical protein QM538_02615 [Methylacidiphilales bacterium]|nr:hypothetical protein [Candidatus Methylacidiphilales bacterium]